jgi:anti-anti-sigma factor
MSDLIEIKIVAQEELISAELQCTELDEQHAENMQDKVKEACEQTPQLPVVLEMSKVEFVPSLSLGALVTLLQTMKQNQRRFILAGIQPNVRETLTICRLNKLFEICESIDEARTKIAHTS